MFSIYAFGIVLLLLAGTLLVSHWRAWWRDRRNPALSETERRFAWRQCRRRSQASAMIGIVGIAICTYELVPRDQLVVTVYLGALIFIVFWIMLLAIGDAMDTRNHYRRLRNEHRRAQSRLVDELNKHGRDDHYPERHLGQSVEGR